MKTRSALVVSFALAAQLAYAAPSKDTAALTGTWTLEERSSDDPVRVLNGERGRGGRGIRVSTGGSIFGVPVGNLPGPARGEDDDEEEDPREDDLGGVEHVFKATYRLRIRREGDATEIRYGNEPTITYRDGARTERDGAKARAQWREGTLTIDHELADGSLVSERYWVDARSGDLHWTAELTRRQGSFDVDRSFYRSEGTAP